jgi:hypothetical protein
MMYRSSGSIERVRQSRKGREMISWDTEYAGERKGCRHPSSVAACAVRTEYVLLGLLIKTTVGLCR